LLPFLDTAILDFCSKSVGFFRHTGRHPGENRGRRYPDAESALKTWIAGYCAALRGPAFAGMTFYLTSVNFEQMLLTGELL